MKSESFTFTGANGASMPAVLWLPQEEPKALLQITHGMTEHMGRFIPMAQELTASGIAVAGFDLRGHGKNPGDPSCSSLGEGGWDSSLEDMHRFYLLMQERFPQLPHAMLGFSLGSFLLRDYLSQYREPVAAAFILGTGWQPKGVLSLLKLLVKGQIRKAGFDCTTPLVRKLSFETYNRKFAPNRTCADWLCADRTQLGYYLADPLCRENISAGLFWQLLDAMERTGAPDACANWDHQMPVFLLSGKEDPVGNDGKGVLKVEKLLKDAGMAKVETHLFPDARHDILHESQSHTTGKTLSIIKNALL